MELKSVEKKGMKAFVREGTSDRFIFEEIQGGAYSKLNIRTDDIVLDIGSNIGIFTLYALQRGAAKVYCYEPEHNNFLISEVNLLLNDSLHKVELFDLAVVGNNDKQRSFYLNSKKNKGAHSLIAKRGRESITVNCVNINGIMQVIRPTIIKMDIEGGEYEVLKAVTSFAGVRELIFEFHHDHLNDIKTHEKYHEILNLMRGHFTNVKAPEDTKGAWVTVVYCSEPRLDI